MIEESMDSFFQGSSQRERGQKERRGLHTPIRQGHRDIFHNGFRVTSTRRTRAFAALHARVTTAKRHSPATPISL